MVESEPNPESEPNSESELNSESEQQKYQGSHFTPDVILSLLQIRIQKNMRRVVLEKDFHIQQRTELKILKD